MTPDFIKWLAQDRRKVLLAEVGVRVGGSETTRYLSNAGLVTGPTDTPANTIYQPRLVGGFSFTRSLSIDGSGGSTSYGELLLDNSDGALDTWLFDVWAMRSIKLYMGDPSWGRSQFELVFDGVIADINVSGRSRLSLRLRDVLAPLDGPISSAKLGGTGDNKDSLLPIALGECFNVEPLLTTLSGLATYKVNLSNIEGVVEVRDNGYPVTVTAGTDGNFTLLYARYGQITCDVQGYKIGAEYRNDTGGLVEWVATTIGDGTKLSSTNIDATKLTAFRSACPQPVGMWVDGQTSRLDICQQLASSVGATVTATLQGKMMIARLAFGTPVMTITPDYMELNTFEPVTRPAVKGAVKLAGCKNWSVQSSSSLAAALETNQVEILSSPTIDRTASNSTTLTNYKQSAEQEAIETLLVVEADIDAEAARRQALWGTPRAVFKFSGYAELLTLELGDTITLKHPRLGLMTGSPAIITSLETDFLSGRVHVEALV